MAWITLRRFVWEAKTNALGVPEVVEITRVPGLRRLPVDVSDVISTNALATPVHRSVLYKATQNELRLLGSYLQHGWGQQVQLLDDPFHASSRQIRGFVSESFGLGMLTATVQAAYRWNARGQMVNMDALPTVLAGGYKNGGPRPDLLFDLPMWRLAGEARGRSRRPPRAPLKEHHDRLNRLLPWADYHNHPLIMTWTYVTGDGTTVDMFTPNTGVLGLDDPLGEEMPASEAPEPDEVMLSRELETLVDVVPSRRHPEDTPGERRSNVGNGFDRTRLDNLIGALRYRVEEIQRQLYITAPETSVHVAGRAVRGEWIPLDLVGHTTASFLFALLDEPLPLPAAAEATEVLRQRMRRRVNQIWRTEYDGRFIDEPDSVTLQGRVLVAVTSERIDRPWELIADEYH